VYVHWSNFFRVYTKKNGMPSQGTVNAASICGTVHFTSHGAGVKHRQEIESKFVLKLSMITRSTALKRIADLQTQDEKRIKRISVLQMRAHELGDLHDKQPAVGTQSTALAGKHRQPTKITDRSVTLVVTG
jgi:hypothetical protein